MAPLKLLVVEDDLACLELMTEVFVSLKAEVHPVSDSEKAARLVKEEKFDGIFLDLEMPHLHGFDLAKQIRKSLWNKSTPIIIVTGQDERKTMETSFALGATFFLQKPIDRQKLKTLFRSPFGEDYLRIGAGTRGFPLNTEVTCQIGPRTMRGMSWNLSQGGIQVEAEQPAPRRYRGLSFRLPVSDAAVDVVGVVVWVEENRQGIQFTECEVHQTSKPSAISWLPWKNTIDAFELESIVYCPAPAWPCLARASLPCSLIRRSTSTICLLRRRSSSSVERRELTGFDK